MERKITAISVQKRNPQRVNIYLDGEFAFGAARIVAAWLEVGQTLSEERIAQLQQEDGSEVAYNLALKLLNYRPRSEQEIRRKLQSQSIPETQIEATLLRLKEAGLVNDPGFAQDWVENRSEYRPRSKRMLAYEMRQRGLDQAAIEGSLAELDENALAYQAASRKAPKLRNLEWPDFKQKLLAFLARRGFNYQVSAPVVAQVWAELHQETEDHGAR